MDLKIAQKNKDSYVVLTVKGEIDLYNARQLKEKINDVMEDNVDTQDILVDIRDVAYIDSTGLGILIGIKRRVTEGKGKLVLVLSSERILKLFSITGLNNIFTIAGDMDAAIARLK